MLSGKNSQAINIFNGNILDGKNVNFNYKKSLGVPPGFFLLSKAANYCSYSQEYLSLLARKGELKSMKFGRNWYTTLEWLQEYTQEHAEGTKGHNKGKMFLVTSAKTGKQEELAVLAARQDAVKLERIIRIIINGVNILSESLKEIFTFEHRIKTIGATKQTKQAVKNYSVFSSQEKQGEEHKILVKQTAIEEVTRELEKELGRVRETELATTVIKNPEALWPSPTHDLNIRVAIGKNGKQEYFDLEPEVDWSVYIQEALVNYLAGTAHKLKSFFVDGVQRIKIFWRYWRIVPTVERWEFGVSWAVIFVCLFSAWAVAKSGVAITYDQQQITELIAEGGKVIDQKLAWVADTYVEGKAGWQNREKTKPENEFQSASQGSQEWGEGKMVAGAQTERARTLEPGEERVVVEDEIKTESLEVIDQESGSQEENDHWWRQWAVKVAKAWTGLVVVEHEEGAKYYQPAEDKFNNAPPGEASDLIRDDGDSQTAGRDYPEENKIIFYQDKSKGRSDNEKVIQEALIGEPINNNSSQSEKTEQNEELYLLPPIKVNY